MANTTWATGDKTQVTLSSGNLTATATGRGGVRTLIAIPSSGQFYWEYTLGAVGSQPFHGIQIATGSLTTPNATGALGFNSSGIVFQDGVSTGRQFGLGLGVGSVIGIAYSIPFGGAWFNLLGDSVPWLGGDPTTGAGIFAWSGLNMKGLFSAQASGAAVTANFGDTLFAGTIPVGYTSFPGPYVGAPAPQAAQQSAMILA
jgi:hypothetical protein